MTPNDRTVLKEMKSRIDKIEEQVSQLKVLGREIPAVQKACRSILGLTYPLKFGISDVADVYDTTKEK